MLPSSGVPSLHAGQRASSPVRVVRVFSRLNIGGPSWHVILLTSGLVAAGYETRLMVGRESPSEGNFLELAGRRGIRCWTVDALGREIRPLPDLVALWRLFREIRAFRPQIVHTHTAKAGVLGRLAARLSGVPVVVHTFHGHVLKGYFGPAKTAFFRWLETRLAATTDSVIAVSEAVKADLVEMGVAPAAKIRVIPLGLDLERLAQPLPRGKLRAESGVAETVPLVGIVGRLVPIKDVGTFLEAARRVLAQRPETRFAIVGDGEERASLESQARELGLGPSLHFHGWKTDVAEVLGDLNLVVNCSRNEGTPVALIEALAAGKPVVATAVGGTPDVLGPNRHGLLVPAGDPEALASAILDCLANPTAAAERARSGQQHVLARHSVTRLLGDVDGLYRELLAARKAA